MIDELYLRYTFPELPWDQPVLITIAGMEQLQVWACRYCIAMHGLKAQDVINERVPEIAYHSREDALAHIETAHHE